METNNEKSIETLNNLLEINNDRIEGYKTAIKETEEADMKALFTDLAATSFKCKNELTAEILKLSGKPVEGTRNTGKLYRVWMDIKAALTGKSRKAILNSCEMGEDVAVKNYQDALKDYSVTSSLYTLISQQYAAIKADHDKVKRLRDLVNV